MAQQTDKPHSMWRPTSGSATARCAIAIFGRRRPRHWRRRGGGIGGAAVAGESSDKLAPPILTVPILGPNQSRMLKNSEPER
jgi:hypothetical protein